MLSNYVLLVLVCCSHLLILYLPLSVYGYIFVQLSYVQKPYTLKKISLYYIIIQVHIFRLHKVRKWLISSVTSDRNLQRACSKMLCIRKNQSVEKNKLMVQSVLKTNFQPGARSGKCVTGQIMMPNVEQRVNDTFQIKFLDKHCSGCIQVSSPCIFICLLRIKNENIEAGSCKKNFTPLEDLVAAFIAALYQVHGIKLSLIVSMETNKTIVNTHDQQRWNVRTYLSGAAVASLTANVMSMCYVRTMSTLTC